MEDPVVESLEIAAEQIGDITVPVYQRYYRDCPDAHEVMAHVDQHMQGRMLDELLRLLMVRDFSQERGYLDFEVENHRAYNVGPEMYPDLCRAVRMVVRDGLGDRWTAAFEDAWADRVSALLAEIDSRNPSG